MKYSDSVYSDSVSRAGQSTLGKLDTVTLRAQLDSVEKDRVTEVCGAIRESRV